MNFLNRLKEKISAFMRGRYGVDELYRGSLVVLIVLIVVGFIVRAFGWTVVNLILQLLTWILLVLSVWRALSKNIAARSVENAKYLVFRERVRSFVKLQKNRFRDRKTHIYRRCPQCRTVLRLPYKKGKNTVSCPQCHHRFDVHAWF